MKKILVTGAGGFIGSHLVELLVSKGYSVKAFVRYNSRGSWGWLDHSPQKVKEAIEVISGDVRDSWSIKRAMKGCDSVLHLAALIGIPYSYHAPDAYIETNIKGTLNILQNSRELNLKRIVITSTSEVYGSAQFVPMTESHPLQAQSPYSASKIGADQMAISFYNSFNTPVTIVRPFNTYGPRQSTRAIIPTIITQIASGSKCIKIGALHPSRDFSFVKDVAAGFVAAMNSKDAVGNIINIGSNYEMSIGDTAHLIASIMGSEVEIVQEKVRLRPESSEVTRLWANNEKAKKLLKWKPLYGGKKGFKLGLQETVDWYLRSENLDHYKKLSYQI